MHARAAAPPAQYAVQVPLFPFVTADRDYSELSRRYKAITVPLDFSHVELPWIKLDVPGPDK